MTVKMDITFLIIDDDISIVKMLDLLIKKHGLGRVVHKMESGQNAIQDILFYNPDIILIDLLLPDTDGIEIINSSISKGYKGKFIMISQVEKEAMISKAYESGISFFIDKPINSIEVINVIKGVIHNIQLERSISMIQNTLLNLGNASTPVSEVSFDEQMARIFTDIGIIGTAGSNDLKRIIQTVIKMRKQDISINYQLQNIYDEIIKSEYGENDLSVQKKALEQRIRRTIQKALQTIAELGKEDYYNNTFMEYSTVLFDFKQVRQEMRHIDNPKEEQGKINIKKFIEGIITKLNYS